MILEYFLNFLNLLCGHNLHRAPFDTSQWLIWLPCPNTFVKSTCLDFLIIDTLLIFSTSVYSAVQIKLNSTESLTH